MSNVLIINNDIPNVRIVSGNVINSKKGLIVILTIEMNRATQMALM